MKRAVKEQNGVIFFSQVAFVCRLYTIRRLRGEKKETKTFLCSSSNLGPRSEMTQSDSDHKIRA